MIKYAFDENSHGHFCLWRKAAHHYYNIMQENQSISISGGGRLTSSNQARGTAGDIWTTHCFCKKKESIGAIIYSHYMFLLSNVPSCILGQNLANQCQQDNPIISIPNIHLWRGGAAFSFWEKYSYKYLSPHQAPPLVPSRAFPSRSNYICSNRGEE